MLATKQWYPGIFMGVHGTCHIAPCRRQTKALWSWFSFYIYVNSSDEVRLCSKPFNHRSQLSSPQDGTQL